MLGKREVCPFTSFCIDYNSYFADSLDCPIGWTSDSYYPYICYKAPIGNGTLDWSSAANQCKILNSTLPIFRHFSEYISFSLWW